MLRWFLALTVAAVSLSTATAAFVVNVVPSTGPVQTDPNLANYYSNAQTSLRGGVGAAVGSVGTSAFYIPAGTSTPGGNINSLSSTGGGVNSLWNGVPNAAGYAGSMGNAMYMGLSLKTTLGSLASPNQVQFNGYNYAFGNTGVVTLTSVLGSGNVFGALTSGGAINPVTPGQAATPFAELYYVGPAYSITNGFPADYTDANSLIANFQNPLTPTGYITGSYTVTAAGGGTFIGSSEVNGAPAPATLVLMGLGFVGSSLVARVRRRRTA